MRIMHIALFAAVVLAWMNVQAVRSIATDAHKSVTYHFTVTNTTDKVQTIESVRTSCACLNVDTGSVNDIPPGGVMPVDVEFKPAGMEGEVKKRVWMTLAPSKKVVTFDVAVDVRLRLGFKPMDAAFGVIRRSDTGREIVAKLSGYAADGVKLGAPLREKNDTMFDVRLAPDGKSIIAKFRDRDILPGIYSETWTIPTSDKEIPEITFAVGARVTDAVSVTPQMIAVGWSEPVCARFVTLRGETRAYNPVNHAEKNLCASASLREDLTVLSAETKPRKWGDVKITPRPMNGWRIDIENIDPREVRQFSKRPFLEVKTNLPGMESFEIPLRVVNDGGVR